MHPGFSKKGGGGGGGERERVRVTVKVTQQAALWSNESKYSKLKKT